MFPFSITGWMIPTYMILLDLLAGAIPTATFTAVPEVMRKPQLVGIGMAFLAFGKVVGMTGWVTSGYLLLIPVTLIASSRPGWSRYVNIPR